MFRCNEQILFHNDLIQALINISISNKRDFRINLLSIRVQLQILFELKKSIPGLGWKEFAAEMQQILHEEWINELYSQIEYSNNPPETLFKCWSTKASYTVSTLINILDNMKHEMLLNLVLSEQKILSGTVCNIRCLSFLIYFQRNTITGDSVE